MGHVDSHRADVTDLDVTTRSPVRVELIEPEPGRLAIPVVPARSAPRRTWAPAALGAVVLLTLMTWFVARPDRVDRTRPAPAVSGPQPRAVLAGGDAERSGLGAVASTLEAFQRVAGDLVIVDAGRPEDPPRTTDLPPAYSPRSLVADAFGYLTWGAGVDGRDRLFSSELGERWSELEVGWPATFGRVEIVSAHRGRIGIAMLTMVAEDADAGRPQPRVFLLPRSAPGVADLGEIIELPSPCPPLDRCPVTSVTAEGQSVVAVHQFRAGLPRTVSSWSPTGGWTAVIGPVLPDTARLSPGSVDHPILATDDAVYEIDLLARKYRPLVDAPPGVGGRVEGVSDSGRVVAFARGSLIMVYSARAGRWASFTRDTFDSYDLLAVSDDGALYRAVGPYGAEVVLFPAP